MRSIERLLDQLNRTFGGPAWHGPALRELLDGVSEEQAKAHPIDNLHSILELVAHIRGAIDLVSERLAGNPKELTTEEDWPDVTRTSFAVAVTDLERSQSRLCDAVARLRPEDLDKIVVNKTYTIYVMVHGAIQHTTYHAGQVAMLKRARALR